MEKKLEELKEEELEQVSGGAGTATHSAYCPECGNYLGEAAQRGNFKPPKYCSACEKTVIPTLN